MGVDLFPEEDLLPISALQHLLFCPRQCALIHLEQLWAENALTLEGRHLHQKADHGRGERRGGLRVARGLLLRSLRLGLFGKADVVEFRAGAALPVEYKRGKPKKDGSDKVQLCAQALCLEEMLDLPVPAGAIFYGVTRRRLEVPFDEPLRRLTLETIGRLHQMIASRATPAAVREKKCGRCSLRHLCLPDARPGTPAASRYLLRALADEGAGGPASD